MFFCRFVFFGTAFCFALEIGLCVATFLICGVCFSEDAFDPPFRTVTGRDAICLFFAAEDEAILRFIKLTGFLLVFPGLDIEGCDLGGGTDFFTGGPSLSDKGLELGLEAG